MKSTQENIQQASRKAWLAGLGLCESSLEFANEKVDDWYTQGNELLNQLLTRGSQLEKDIQQKLSVPDAITDVLKRVESGVSEKTDTQIQSLSDKVDQLTLLVAELTKAQEDTAVKSVVKSRTANKSAGSAKDKVAGTKENPATGRKSPTANKPKAAASKGRSTAASTKSQAVTRTKQSSAEPSKTKASAVVKAEEKPVTAVAKNTLATPASTTANTSPAKSKAVSARNEQKR